MPPDLLNALVAGGSSAVLLGIVLWRLAPRQQRSFERLVRLFSEQLERERSASLGHLTEERKAHAQQLRELTAGLVGLAKETRQQTLHIVRQTGELRELRRDLSADLPNPPPLPLPEQTIDLMTEEEMNEPDDP